MQAESSYHVTWTLANVITELCFIISVCCLFLFWESYGEHFAKLYFNKFFYSLALLQCTSTIRSGENCSDNNTPCSFVFFFFSEYLCHVYVRNDNLGAVVIADTEYPQRVCFTLLDKVVYIFFFKNIYIYYETCCCDFNIDIVLFCFLGIRGVL